MEEKKRVIEEKLRRGERLTLDEMRILYGVASEEIEGEGS